MLAYLHDGHAMGADGPFQLVVPGDQRAARWVRNVSSIELLDAATQAQP